MTDPSSVIPEGPADPLIRRRQEVKGTSWKWVVGLLLGIPMILALTLSTWLGTPREEMDEGAVFPRLGIRAVPTESLESLAYGNLFFVRMRLKPDGRRALGESLQSFKTSRGQATRPITLELERSWWDPPQKVEGTLWQRAQTSFWIADSKPETVYVVVVDAAP